jgi:hypothetical protein
MREQRGKRCRAVGTLDAAYPVQLDLYTWVQGGKQSGKSLAFNMNTLIASGIQQSLHNMLHALRCKPCGFSSCMKNTHKACNQGMCHNLAQQGYVRTAPLVSSSRCLLESAAGNEMPHIVAHRCIIEASIGKHIESPHSPGHRSYHTMIE